MKNLFLLIFLFGLVRCTGTDEGEGVTSKKSNKCKAVELYNSYYRKNISCFIRKGAASCEFKAGMAELYKKGFEQKLTREDLDEIKSAIEKEVQKIEPIEISGTQLKQSQKLWSSVYKNVEKIYDCR